MFTVYKYVQNVWRMVVRKTAESDDDGTARHLLCRHASRPVPVMWFHYIEILRDLFAAS